MYNTNQGPINGTTTNTSPALQIEALEVPSRQPRSAHSSNYDNILATTGITGGNPFSLSPRSGRVSPQLSPTFPINTESTMNATAIAHTLSARHTTHTSSPVFQPDNQLPLLSVDELQFGSHRNSSGSKRSSKHRNKEASAGTESAKSKSPRYKTYFYVLNICFSVSLPTFLFWLCSVAGSHASPRRRTKPPAPLCPVLMLIPATTVAPVVVQ